MLQDTAWKMFCNGGSTIPEEIFQHCRIGTACKMFHARGNMVPEEIFHVAGYSMENVLHWGIHSARRNISFHKIQHGKSSAGGETQY